MPTRPLIQRLIDGKLVAGDTGNGRYIFTRDGDAGGDFSDNILLGIVGLNVPLSVVYHSFGVRENAVYSFPSNR